MSSIDYRKLWENVNGAIPIDDGGRPYEIHHCDGDRNNNNIENLMCLSIKEHYDIHYQQGDYGACLIMSERMKIPYDEAKRLAKLAASKRDQNGEKNPNWGNSTSKAVKKVWDARDEEYRKKFGKKVSMSKKKAGSVVGKKNPMYGRSAVVENKLKWYNNGEKSIYIPEGTQPQGYVPGRGKVKWD